jgi:hypothetical protein
MKFVAKLRPGIAVATLSAVALLMVAIASLGIGDSSAHAADPVWPASLSWASSPSSA